MTSPTSADVEFEGRHISLVTSVYADRVFIIVNELPSFGTLVSSISSLAPTTQHSSRVRCSQISASIETYPDGAVEFELKTLLGDREEELLTLLARRLVECIQ